MHRWFVLPLILSVAFASAQPVVHVPPLTTGTAITLPGGVKLDLVRVPAGTFQMGAANDSSWGSTDQEPVHAVTIPHEFWMGKYELTQGQWKAIMTTNPSTYPTGDSNPVDTVSWNMLAGSSGFLDLLNQYCVTGTQGSATFRLPSEGEWEYACRAGTNTRFYFGDSDCATEACESCDLRNYAWYCGNTAFPRSVGGKLPNSFGLYDMHGNMFEWCQDWYHSDYISAPADGSAWISPVGVSRVLRGGSWANFPVAAASAARTFNNPGSAFAAFGARLLRSQGPDLRIVSVSVSGVDTTITYSVVVENRGTVASSACTVDLQLLSLTPPSSSYYGDLYPAVLPPLDPGTTATATLTWQNAVPGSYISWAIADAGNFIPELEEETNVAGPLVYRVPAVSACRDDRYTTAGAWVYAGHGCIGGNQGVSADFDSANQALRLRVYSATSQTAPRTRQGGWYAGDPANTIPYSAIGSANFVRAKFYVYADGQANPSQKNQIPGFSMRVGSRFAVTSNLEVTPHVNAISANDKYGAELAPSGDPQRPSVYRVDFDPIEVPYYVQYPNDPIYMSFAVNSFDWQDNGNVCLKEISSVTYPASLLPSDAWYLKKTYLASAGDLDIRNGAGIAYNMQFDPALGEGAPPIAVYTTGPNRPLLTTSAAGTTYNSSPVPTNQVGIIEHYFSPNRFGALPWSDGPRVQENKMYKISFHVTSTQGTNRQCPFWLYTRSIGYSWIQKTEFGGSWAVTDPSDATNLIIRQAQPGVGSTVTNGWYKVLMTTPMAPDIRSDSPTTASLRDRMPQICAQPGPGANAFSWRELCCGAMLLDTLNYNWAADKYEVGDFTIDRVEVREYDAILD